MEGHGEELVQLVRCCDSVKRRREKFGVVGIDFFLMACMGRWVRWCMVLHIDRFRNYYKI